MDRKGEPGYKICIFGRKVLIVPDSWVGWHEGVGQSVISRDRHNRLVLLVDAGTVVSQATQITLSAIYCVRLEGDTVYILSRGHFRGLLLPSKLTSVGFPWFLPSQRSLSPLLPCQYLNAGRWSEVTARQAKTHSSSFLDTKFQLALPAIQAPSPWRDALFCDWPIFVESLRTLLMWPFGRLLVLNADAVLLGCGALLVVLLCDTAVDRRTLPSRSLANVALWRRSTMTWKTASCMLSHWPVHSFTSSEMMWFSS